MILSYNWLEELAGAGLAPEELAAKLTRAGLNIEGIAPAAGGDYALSAEVTTNRPDWLCHLGVAREVAAVVGGVVKEPEAQLEEKGPDVFDLSSVAVHSDASEHCPRYTARIIRGVKVGTSPEWLRNRLLAIGQRPINNVVDVSNFVCFEMNQPLHAFDVKKLAGGRITVRMARRGEEFAAITGEKCALAPDLLVIADDARAVALAGVKGGENSEVDVDTSDILLESAYFQPKSVRRSARHAKIQAGLCISQRGDAGKRRRMPGFHRQAPGRLRAGRKTLPSAAFHSGFAAVRGNAAGPFPGQA